MIAFEILGLLVGLYLFLFGVGLLIAVLLIPPVGAAPFAQRFVRWAFRYGLGGD